MLQEQMAIMTHHQGSSSPTSIKREQDVITQHRKRKKVDEDDEGVGGGVLTNPNVGLISMPPPKPHIQHWYHRLPIDTLERSTMLTRIADKQVGEACWNSFSNFLFDVPERFRRHVTCERLMELDSNTRYGARSSRCFAITRTITDTICIRLQLMKTGDDIAQRRSWLYDSGVRAHADQGVRTTFRSITHSTPPVGVMTHPRGKVNEAFLTVFCRNADTVENSAWNLLMKTHPERMPKAEVVV
ncbi:hypothetical protein GQ600_23664 [Phytophthora cactorum]|nr:hypothetical protein GQ600_23664 [Phytophthora cactorum]